MRLSTIYENYFIETFQSAYHYDEKSLPELAFTAVKLGSFATVVIPLAFFTLFCVDYATSTLYDRIQHFFEDDTTKNISEAIRPVFQQPKVARKKEKKASSLSPEQRAIEFKRHSQDLKAAIEEKNRDRVSVLIKNMNDYLHDNEEDLEKWENFWYSFQKDKTYIVQYAENKKEFKIPQSLMSLQTSLFSTMELDLSKQDIIRFPIVGASDETISLFLTCMERGYIGDAINEKNMMEFANIADRYEIEWMLEVSKEFIISKLDTKNVVDLYKSYDRRHIADDPLTKACFVNLLERFKLNPDHQEILERFHSDNHASLKKLFTEIKKVDIAATIELLFLILPDKSAFAFPKLDDALILDQIPRYFKATVQLGTRIKEQSHKDFLSAFKVICPSNEFMSFNERSDLFTSLLLLFPGKMIQQLTKDPFFSNNDLSLITTYRKLFSGLIKAYSHYCMGDEKFDKLFGDLIDKSQILIQKIYQTTKDGHEDILFILKEIVKFPDQLPDEILDPNVQMISHIFKQPREIRKELIVLANRNLEEISYMHDFYFSRAAFIQFLLSIRQEERENALSVGKLCNIISVDWTGNNPTIKFTSLAALLPENARFPILKSIAGFVENLEDAKRKWNPGVIDKFSEEVFKFANIYIDFYNRSKRWMVEPYLNLIQPKTISDLCSIENLLNLQTSIENFDAFIMRMQKYFSNFDSKNIKVSNDLKIKLVALFLKLDAPDTEATIMATLFRGSKPITNSNANALIEALIKQYE